jgi:hypothetical protein
MSVKDYGQIRDSIREIAKQDIPYSRLCKVISVDDSAFTCEVSPIDNLDISFYDVRLTSSTDPTVLQIPTVDSDVIVSFLDESNVFVSMFSQVDKVTISNADENLKLILLDYMEAMNMAIQLMTLKHPQGPTTPEPINMTDFQSAFDTASDSLENLLGD